MVPPPPPPPQALPKALGSKARKHIEALFLAMMPASLRCVRRELKEISPTEDIGLARTTMNIMVSMMDDFMPIGEGEEALPAPGERRFRGESSVMNLYAPVSPLSLVLSNIQGPPFLMT